MTHINGPFWRIYQFTNERRQDADSQTVYNWPCAMIDYSFNPCKMTLQFYHVLQLQPLLSQSFTKFQSWIPNQKHWLSFWPFCYLQTQIQKHQMMSTVCQRYSQTTCLPSRFDLKGSIKPTFGLTESEILRILKSSPPRRKEKARYIGPQFMEVCSGLLTQNMI